VVDDNVDAAFSLAKVLSRMYDQEVRVAHDGPSALEAAEEFRPEAVILDIEMPDMDGHEVARKLRERPELEGVVLIALTGWGQEDDRRRSEEAGFDYHLAKPVQSDVLLGLLTAPRSVAPHKSSHPLKISERDIRAAHAS
jgi:CheY-like chemotaxis protein